MDALMERSLPPTEKPAPVIPTLIPRPQPVQMPGILPVTIRDVSPRPGCVMGMMIVWIIVTSSGTVPSPHVGLTSGNVALDDASPSPSNVTLTTTVETSQVTFSF